MMALPLVALPCSSVSTSSGRGCCTARADVHLPCPLLKLAPSKWHGQCSLVKLRGLARARRVATAAAQEPVPVVSSSAVHAKLPWTSNFVPPPEAYTLLQSAIALLKRYFWPVLLVFAAKDLAAFVLHRLSHRLTNFVAESMMGMPISQLANPWWLYLDSAFLESHLAYQAIIVAVFLLCLPLNILLSSMAMAASTLVCTREPPAVDSGLSTPQGSVDLVALAAVKPFAATFGTSTAATGATGGKFPAVPTSIGEVAWQPGSSQSSGSSATTSITGSAADIGSFLPSSSSTSSSSSSPASGPASPDLATAAAQYAANLPAEVQAAAPQAAGAGPAPAVASSSTAAQEPAAAAAAGKTDGAKPGNVFKDIRQGYTAARAVVPETWDMLQRIWWVDLLFNAQALPLQALSMLVFPVFWTVPWLLGIQLALPAAIMEGHAGKAALERSQQLMRGFKLSYGWPFVALILGIRALDVVRNVVLAAIPPRWWQDVIEVPILLTLAFSFAKLVVVRLQDLVPLSAYLVARHATPKAPMDPPPVLVYKSPQPSI